MKKLAFISFFLFSIGAFAQFTDDFSDANLAGRWTGNVENFTVNSSGQLQSNTGTLPAAANYYISRESTLAGGCEWNFWINLKFSTSGSNYVDFYLMSDRQDLKAGNINGYFVRIGDSADKISLYKKMNGSNTEIIIGENGLTGSTNNNFFFIKVVRSADNIWSLQYNQTGWDGIFTLIGTPVLDASVVSSSYMGIWITQSTAVAPVNNHFLDDIYAGEITRDVTPPIVSSVKAEANEMTVFFSEQVQATGVENFTVEGVGSPSNVAFAPDGRSAILTFENNFEKNVVYTLFITRLADMNENVSNSLSAVFAVPTDDLIINEIMFNSADGSEDYIEIYNNSDGILDLTGFRFIRQTSSTAQTVNIPAGTTIAAHSYLAFTAYPDQLREQFAVPDAANIVTLNFGTFLPNSEATIRLAKGVILFDELSYSEKWHSPLISDRKGVALERISPDASTNDALNWASAASNVHWGTPGYENSRFRDDTPTITGKRVWAEPENFTPDNDGHHDITNIHFSTDDTGFFATVFIYDARGRKLRTLASNLLISPDAFIRWDGTDDNGKIVNVGIYAVYAEIIRTDGKREHFKFPCVVSAVKR